MTTDLPALKYHLRPFEARDIAPWTAILNNIYPDEPSTMEQNEHWERTYPADNPRFRRVAETAEGQLVGYGECQRPYWSSLKTDTCMVFVAVDPAWQHRGVGQALYAAVTPFAETLRAVKLRTDCSRRFRGHDPFPGQSRIRPDRHPVRVIVGHSDLRRDPFSGRGGAIRGGRLHADHPGGGAPIRTAKRINTSTRCSRPPS